MNTSRVAVLGAGSWGTALAFLIARNGHSAVLWARDQTLARAIEIAGENMRYLPGTSLQNIEISADLEAVVQGADWIVSAVPCAGVPVLVPFVAARKTPKAVVVSGTKGLHPHSGERAAQMWESVGSDYVALSGPNLAREIVSGVPTSSVVASTNEQTARRAQELFGSNLFRVYFNTDLVGVELGGALKNVVAIAAGICDGLGFGDNAKAAIMTRHWREMTRLAVALGAREATLGGLSGIGDLFATCASPHSRNYSLGVRLGRGEGSMQAQRDVMQVTEGVHTSRAALGLAASHGLELPVTEQLAAVLFDERPVRQCIEALMNREGRAELES